MSVSSSSRTTQMQIQISFFAWLDRNKSKVGKWTLISMVVTYVAFLIVTPISALAVGALQKGIGASIASLNHADVFVAFWNTLWISLVVVIIHTVFGTVVAWVFVRHRFPGRNLINGLIDMPFAVSPVVAGYMLLLLFGRTGMLAPVIDTLGIRVAFAMPGMVLATLFVTLPFMIRELIPVMEALILSRKKPPRPLEQMPGRHSGV